MQSGGVWFEENHVHYLAQQKQEEVGKLCDNVMVTDQITQHIKVKWF